MRMLLIALLAELLTVTTAYLSDTYAIIDSTETSLAMQVINILKATRQNNDSFTFYIHPGTYNATNGTQTEFYYFSNITLQKDPRSSGEVIIQCPNFTDDGDFNSLGFINCSEISIIGLTFTKCGQKSSASYFGNVSNSRIVNSTFHNNRNNGLEIYFGRNISIINCTIESNVGRQNDCIDFLIQQVTNLYGGPGLRIALQDIADTTITVENCTFRNNIALKSISYDDNDSRPYNYIPFGNGGGIYVNLNNVTNVTIKITNCHFYNNTALHQGGGIVVFMIASHGNRVEVTDCDFIENKAIGYPLLNQIDGPISKFDDKFIAEINRNFSIENFNESIRDVLLHIPSQKIQGAGGFGGAIIVNFFRKCEHNQIFIKRSTFKKNVAIGAAAIGIFMWESLSSITSGINSNRAWFSRYA